MAIHKEIEIDVVESGMDEAIRKANVLQKGLTNVGQAAGSMASGMRESGNAVLENGGALGVLSEFLGPNVMLTKDAIEASVLFTKSQKIAAIQQKIYALSVGTSTGAMKAFRIALVSTGIGAIVVALGMLIANFDKVKKVVLNLVPGLSVIGDLFGGLIDAVTDFIGVTSDATRELDKMVANAEASLKRNEHFLEANGDKFDEYTQRKIKANIDYNKKVKELNEDEELNEAEKLERLKDFREKANREITKADKDREDANTKRRQDAADKQAQEDKKRADDAKRIADDAQKKKDEVIAKEKERTDAISKILEDYRKKEEDAIAQSNLAKINLEEKRQLEELDRLKATEEEKAKIRAYYDGLRLTEQQRLDGELAAIEVSKQDAQRNLMLDQKEWEAENETDPLLKLQKQREVLVEQGNLELEKLQKDIDNAQLSATERANAEIQYAKVKQDLNQSLAANDKQQADEQEQRDKAVAENRKAVAINTASALAELGGKGAEFAKGIAVAQAVQDTYKGATSAFSAMSGIPIVGPALGAVAAGVVVAAGVANVKKILSSKPSASGAGAGMTGASVPAPPPAPSFNLVQGTGSNQIAEAMANTGNKPIEAFVVTSNVTTGQSMDRNIVQNATL